MENIIPVDVTPENSEALSAQVVNLSLMDIDLHVLARIEGAEFIAIVDEKGDPRLEPITESVVIEPILADALTSYFLEKGIHVVIDASFDSFEYKGLFTINVVDFNKAIGDGSVEISFNQGTGSYKLDDLGEYISVFRKEHAFDRKFNPEIEEE